MSNLQQRILTAAVGGIAVIYLIYWNQYGFAFLFTVLNTIALWEFYKLTNANKLSVASYPAIVAGIVLFGIGYITVTNLVNQWFSNLIYIFPFLFFILELFRNKENPFGNIAFTLMGWIYITFPFYILTAIAFRDGAYNFRYVYGFLFLLWASDSCAYFLGRSIGKNKLFERISPKKTWEGLLGAFLGAGATAYVLSLFYTELSLVNWLVVASIIVIAGTLGDLVESMFKRSLEIKDSGSILPGHGGILDRFDGFFVSVPFVYLYLSLL